MAGRTVVYERVKEYWGKDLNVNIGRDNFDELRFEYFRDSTVAIEAFKADMSMALGEHRKNWATAYDFPAVTDGRVVLEEFPQRSREVMQASPSTSGATSSRTPGCGRHSILPSPSRR